MTLNSTLKAQINDLAEQVANLFTLTASPEMIVKTITKFYDLGVRDMEVKLDMNLFGNYQRAAAMAEYVGDNIKDLTEETRNNLRKTVTQGLLNIENPTQISDRIQKTMDVAENRAKMIARTETNRAFNMGNKDAAKDSGLNLVKQWDAHIDARTSQVCKDLNGKQVGLDEKFKWHEQEFDIPPAHVNCRSRVIYVQK